MKSSLIIVQSLSKNLLGSSLILVKKAILIDCCSQKAGRDQVESLHRQVKGGGGHRCHLRNPAAI